jgi:hypothetical protein
MKKARIWRRNSVGGISARNNGEAKLSSGENNGENIEQRKSVAPLAQRRQRWRGNG